MFEFTPMFLTTSVITLLICIFGLVGNVLCVLVLYSKHMSRSSYVYLLQGLTLADISLLTLSTLRTLANLGVLQFGEGDTAQIVIFFWDWIGTSSTKYYTVAIALERFFVVTFPFAARIFLTKKRSRLTAFGILTFTTALSFFSYAYVNWIDPESFHIYVAIVLHLLPFILVLTFNLLIFVWLRKVYRQQSPEKANRGKTDEYNVTKMLFVSGTVFGICYSFEFVRRIMNFMWREYMNTYDYYDYTINHLADIFYVLNSSVNFLIYSLIGSKFREVFRKIFNIPSGERGSSSESGDESKSKESYEAKSKDDAVGGVCNESYDCSEGMKYDSSTQKR